jgi:hypothetical protein
MYVEKYCKWVMQGNYVRKSKHNIRTVIYTVLGTLCIAFVFTEQFCPSIMCSCGQVNEEGAIKIANC